MRLGHPPDKALQPTLVPRAAELGRWLQEDTYMRKGYKILLWLFAGGVFLVVVIGFLSVGFWGMKAEAPMPNASPPPDDPLEAVDRILEKMQFGNAAFNVPAAMNLRDTASIQLMLSLVTPTEELKKMIDAEGLKEGARIQVSDRMEARLSGSNFAITAVTPEVQAISRHATTEWKWDIKPVSEGKQYLHLTLSALINANGASTPRAIRTFDKIIEVEVTWRQKISLFIEKNWQWLWAVILAPLAGWLWKRRKAFPHNGAPDNS